MRELSIGASQAAAAAGLHPYCPPIRLWSELMGFAPPFEGNQRTRWGNLIEPSIRAGYAAKYGVHLLKPPGSFYHPEHPWRRATPDSVVVPGPDRIDRLYWERGVECKNTDWTQAHRWESGPPVEAEVQTRWSMHVIGLPRWDVAGLIGGNDDRDFPIERDLELEGMLVEAVEQFWVDHVLTREPPPPDGSRAYAAEIVRRWPRLREDYLSSSLERDLIVAELRAAKDAKADAEQQEKALIQDLLLLVGDARGFDSSLGRVHCALQTGRARPAAVLERLVADGVVTQERIDALTDELRGGAFREVRLPRRKQDV